MPAGQLRGFRPLPAAVLAALASLASLTVACGGDQGPPIASFEAIDYGPSAMVMLLGRELRLPYVVELPYEGLAARHDLRLEGPSLQRVLREIEKLEPAYTADVEDGVLLYLPTGKVLEESTWSRRLESFDGEGGAFPVILEMLQAAGIQDDIAINFETAGGQRPVSVHLRDQTLRDGLVQVARQAHLGMNNDPGNLRITVVDER